jgi:hypothetical protein
MRIETTWTAWGNRGHRSTTVDAISVNTDERAVPRLRALVSNRAAHGRSMETG